MDFQKAIEYLVNLGRSDVNSHIQHIYVGGSLVPFVSNKHDFSPLLMPMPEVLWMNTLTGLVDYIKANRDDLDLSKKMIHVESPTRVHLCGPLSHATQQRPVFVSCRPLLPTLCFGEHIKAEQFNMQLQYGFVDTLGRRELLAFIGSIRQESSVDTEDDGVTQVVTAKAGIARVAEVPAPNPVYLRPYRTFPEIEQPESAFILRMQPGPLCGLWEGDGGAWRNSAMYDIKAFFKAELPEIAILA